ncbi:MAG: hypothetical protein MI742_08975 [Desulfobacterales bacterium]|nr:hypothetical protein [Desulfobacterales bacterium]
MNLLKIGALFLLLTLTACSSQDYVYPLHFETLLKDRSILSFDVTIYMKSEEGLEELKKKLKQVRYGMRLILIQRYPDQVDSPKRIKSVIRKLCKSQIRNGVDHLEITDFSLKRYMGLSGYIKDGKGSSISRKGLTGE